MAFKNKEKLKMDQVLNDAIEDVKLFAPFNENIKGYEIDYTNTNKDLGYTVKIIIEKLIPDSVYL